MILVASKMIRRSAVALTMTGLMLTGCAEPPAPYPYNPSNPYQNGMPQPQPAQSYPGWPTAPQDAAPADLPPAAPAETVPWTEPPLSQPTPTPAPSNPADANPTAAPSDNGTSSPGSDQRLNALKNNLERATPAASSAGAGGATPAGCTHVHQRTGFHDHYGG